MILEFSVNFHTNFGQNLFLSGSLPEMGSSDTSKAIPLKCNGDIWSTEIKLSNIQERLVAYRYFVRENKGIEFFEVGEGRILGLNSISKRLIIKDEWQGNTPSAPFLSAPFASIFFAHGGNGPTQTHLYSKELIIRVTAPNVEKDADLYIVGNHPFLGGWNTDKALPLSPIQGAKWVINLPLNKISGHIEYKFIKKYNDHRPAVWEFTENHVLEIPALEMHETLCIEHSMAAFAFQNPRFAGTAIPVFALRSNNSCGIGDFTDIRLMADWAEQTGQSVLQLLPINDTTSSRTWTDSYPYGGISVMALHPIYLNLKAIGPFKDKETTAKFNKEKKILNALKEIDYEKVYRFKEKYAKILFDTYSLDTFAEPDFYTFYKKNKSWLLSYCAFCILRDRFKTADFSKWGEYSKFTPAIIEKLNKKGTATYFAISYNLFIQYHLHKQLSESVAYAHSKGIALKGDIPIGITPQSVEAWAEPRFFNMNSQAGAPPDDFSVNGQNWGFPTYNWDALAQDDYLWWKRRFKKMSEYFDAYRIDHVLGFFRIWEIPSEQVKGLMGHFSPALPFGYDEMVRSGFHFDYYRHARPFIRYYMLQEMFHEKAQRVMEEFLDSSEYEIFTLKPQFDTQRKIEDYFEGRGEDDLKEGLQALVSEVLFLEDPKQKGKFHPRISAQFTYSFNALSQEEKDAFNRLYDHFFYHRHNEFWKAQAMKKLPELISATNMLSCAEDLGMIPSCVPEVLGNLRLCTLEIQRMPKDPTIKFADPAHYPYMSVCTTGTHDTSTIRGWWEENRETTQEYFNTVLKENGPAPQFCEPWICEKIVKMHLCSSSILTILPLQDYLSLDGALRAKDPASERINIPANPKHYWRYRMHISIEDLLKQDSFNLTISNLIKNSL